MTTLDFSLVGIGLEAGPEYQAVPKGIQTLVDTTIDAQGFDVDLITSQLPRDYRVKAELTGPAFQTPLTLQTRPGDPFDLPTLALAGKHTLSDIRLEDGAGNILFGAVPQAVIIESINDPLITEVKTRQLTLEEIQERGVTFDDSNFDAYEFTAAIATESGQVPLALPVLIPTQEKLVNPEDIPTAGEIGLPTPSVSYLPPKVETVKIPPNLSVSPVIMRVKEETEFEEEIELPPIPGIVVIPGNIGFLHQYFSALALVTNGAPTESDLVIKDVKARILFPAGEDLTAGTDSAPGDDPLRMAKGEVGYVPRTLGVMHAGPDGLSGTADDISRLAPAETGQADFTIEGLKEGTHKIDFEITATLEGLPKGPVELVGHAVGAVLVRNPDFSVTLSHPAKVRSGEEYDLYVTVTNTGKSIANLVSLSLNSLALSGAAFVKGETPDKELESILPGDSATAHYRMMAQRTGEVTATVLVSEEVKGRFNLRTGVGENDIPLSPDSLIFPYAGGLPPDLTDAVIALLGQAWSIATAPAGALPASVLPISKQTITDRAYDFGEAGLRVLIGDTQVKALEDFTFDLFGSDKKDVGLDDLRRHSTQGLKINGALGTLFAEEIETEGPFAFQAGFADKVSYRPGHISVITGPAPVRVRLADALGNRSGGLDADTFHRDLPCADQLVLGEDGTSRSTLTLATALESASYRLDLWAEGPATLDLGVVVPDADGNLQQARFAGVSLPAGALAVAMLQPGTDEDIVLTIDVNGDRTVDRTVLPSKVQAIDDKPPTVTAASQIVPGFGPGGDKHGRNVAVLFSETVTPESARNLLNYSVDTNEVKIANLQPGGRMAFILLRDGIGPFLERHLTVDGLTDFAGQSMTSPEILKIRATARGPAAVVNGTVRESNGSPVPNATVRLMQNIWYDDGFSIEKRWAVFSEKLAGSDGTFHFDYVLQNSDPAGPFRIEAIHPRTGEAGQATTGVAHHGQQIPLDVFMCARGALSGVVRDEAGNSVSGVSVQITTLSDGRRYAKTSDATGSFAFSGISVGPFNLKAVHTASLSQGTAMGTLPEDGSALVQDVTVYQFDGIALGTVSGTVLEPDGSSPRAGVVVMVRGSRYQNWMRSGNDGGFSFTGVYAGGISVEAWDDATGEAVKVSGSVTDQEVSVFNIILPGTGVVEGSVQRADNGTLENLFVILKYGRDMAYAKLLRTDAAGNFRLENVPAGEVRLQVLDPDDYNREIAAGEAQIFGPGELVTVPLLVPAEALQTGTIQGTVYHSNGAPWAHAQIRLANLQNNTYTPFSADGSGHYVIPNAPLKTHHLAVVQGGEVINATTSLWYGGQVKTLDLHSKVVGTVTGVIFDDPEKTFPVGADVSISSLKPNTMGWLTYESNHATIKSDPQTGRFTFNGVYEGTFSVKSSNIFRPNPVTASGSISPSKNLAEVELILRGSPPEPESDPGATDPGDKLPGNARGSISGHVTMPDGTSAQGGVRLTTLINGAEVTVLTDTDGSFQFSPIIPFGNHELIAFDPITTLTWKGNVYVPPGGDVSVTPRLLGRGDLTVRVFNADGTPAPGIPVSAGGIKYPNDTAFGPTDDAGTLSFSNLTEGTYAITASGSHGRGGKAQGIIGADGIPVTVDICLDATGSVLGTFFKADGQTPIPGGQVALRRSGATVGYGTSSSHPATLGQFRIDYVPLGTFTLEGFDPVSGRIGKSGGQLSSDGQVVTTKLVVGARGSVGGIVLNNSGTSPVARAFVDVKAGNYHYTTTTGSDGLYFFAGVPAGSFDLDARDPANGLHGQTTGTLSYEGEVVQTELRIAPTGSIEGQVLMVDGVTPATNVTVSFKGHGVQVDPVTGGFAFAGLAAGSSYSVSAKENNTNRSGGTVVSIREDGDIAFARIVLNGIGKVEGTIFDSDGVTPLPGAQVDLSSKVDYTGFTDFDGQYRFENIPQGAFSMRVIHPQRETAGAASGSIAAEGQIVNIDLTIGPIAAVTGTVFLWDGLTSAAGGGVRFTGGGSSFTTVIDAEGHFGFSGIPIPCEFSLHMEDADGIGVGKVSGSLNVNGEIFDVGTIILDEAPIRVAGVFPAPGAVNIPVDTEVKFLFSEPADPATVTSSRIYLAKGSSKIAGQLVPDADYTGATIIPDAPLAGLTLYQAVVAGITDRVGRPLPSTFVSTFTTVDNVPPVVTSVSPADAARQVASDSVIRITFSEPIDASATDGIRLIELGNPVSARLDLAQGQTVAILTPISPMRANAVYTLFVQGVADTIGNVMTGSYQADFYTVDTLAPTIAELTISEGSCLIAGAQVTLNAAVTDSDVAGVDFYLNDQILGRDVTSPFSWPLLLEKAGSLNLKAIAEDRAGNRGPARQLDVTIRADHPPTVVIIPPEEGSLVTTGGSLSITVSAQDDLELEEIVLIASGELTAEQRRAVSGASAESTFLLQVPDAIRAEGVISLSAVAVDSAGTQSEAASLTVNVADTLPPRVILASSGEQERFKPGQEGSAKLTATDNAELISLSCTTQGAATGEQNWSIEDGAAQFEAFFSFTISPEALPHAAILLSCTARDGAGLVGLGALELLVADTEPPRVLGIEPTDGGVEVPVTTTVSVGFTEPVAHESLAGHLVVFSNSDNTILDGSLALSADQRLVTFLPAMPLAFSTTYTVTVLPGIRDDSGNRMDLGYQFSFSTEAFFDPAMVARWTFDGTWEDASGHDYHLTPGGGVDFSPEALMGEQAAELDGWDDCAQLVDPAEDFSIGSGSWTILAWIRPAYLPGKAMKVVSRYECGWNNCAPVDENAYAICVIQLDGNGSPAFSLRDDLNQSLSVNCPEPRDLRDGQWHHLVGQLDREGGMLRLFLDGDQHQAVSASHLGEINDAGSPLEIGRLYIEGWGSPVDYYQGQVDEVVLYRRALLPEEIREHYMAGLTGDRTPPAAPLVDPVPSPTYDSRIVISGMKEPGTSLWINGRPAVALGDELTWEAQIPLSPGMNDLRITARDASGNRSREVRIQVELFGSGFENGSF